LQTTIETALEALSSRNDETNSLSCLPLDDDKLRRLLRERQTKGPDQSDPSDDHEISPSKFVTIYKASDDEEYLREERVVKIDLHSPEQTEIATITSRRCKTCNEPIDKTMFGFVRPCFSCKRETCPRCRANTDQNEYLRPEVRGQPVCMNCWNSKTILEQLMVHCPSCGQRVRSYSDIKQCAGWCREKLCPSCGIPTGADSLVCKNCHVKYSLLQEELHR
jgi:hypothetical protein